MTDLDQYLAMKRMHINRIQHLDKTGDLEGLDHAMRKYTGFLAKWKRKGIHTLPQYREHKEKAPLVES